MCVCVCVCALVREREGGRAKPRAFREADVRSEREQREHAAEMQGESRRSILRGATALLV